MFSLILLLFLCPKPRAETPEAVRVPVGGSVTVPAGPQESVWVGNSRILKVRESAKGLEVFGRKLGQTRLKVGARPLDVRVIPTAPFSEYELLQAHIQRRMGLDVGWSGDTPCLTGQVHRFEDWRDLKLLNHLHPFCLKVKWDADVVPFFEQHLEEIFKRHQLPTPQIEHTPHTVVRVSPLPDSTQKDLEKELGQLGVGLLVDQRDLETAPLIRTEIVVAEINRSLQEQWGLEWSDSYTAKLLPKPVSGSELQVTLKALENKGQGQILANPTLLSRSGGRAEFLAGGEFPIKIIGFDSRDVVWKKHGILLTVLPKADLKGRMSIDLITEISAIDPAQSVEGIPGLKTNRIASQFDLTSSRTIALSGLIKREWGKSQKGVMGLEKVPLLGALFRSQSFMEKQTELVVFATPSVVTHAP